MKLTHLLTSAAVALGLATTAMADDKTKVGFVYVGPVGDGGWTFEHNEGRLAVEEEFGDLLFVMANLARHMGVEPEGALRATNAKFTRRFEKVEAKLAARGKTPSQSDLTEMDALWDEVKAEEKAAKNRS